MKRTLKKLSLRAETVRVLATRDLSIVAGGVIAEPGPPTKTSCWCGGSLDKLCTETCPEGWSLLVPCPPVPPP